MSPQVCALFVGQPLPNRRSEDRRELVWQLLRIFRIKIERPIDTTAGVPLQLLALLIKSMERLAAVFVLPLEAALEGLGHHPFGTLDRFCIAVNCRHRLSPSVAPPFRSTGSKPFSRAFSRSRSIRVFSS